MLAKSGGGPSSLRVNKRRTYEEEATAGINDAVQAGGLAWRGLGGEVVGGRSKPRPYGSKRERTLILVETGRGPF